MVAANYMASAVAVRPTVELVAVGAGANPALPLNRTPGDDVVLRIDGPSFISKTSMTLFLRLVLFAIRFVSWRSLHMRFMFLTFPRAYS